MTELAPGSQTAVAERTGTVLDERSDFRLAEGDLTGLSGLQASQDVALAGQAGVSIRVVPKPGSGREAFVLKDFPTKPGASVTVTLDPEMLPTWLANNGLPTDMSLADAAKNPKVRDEVQLAVDRANKSVSRAESIRKFTILPIEWTEDSGHLTPKMSIKRDNILRDFSAEIAEMYGENPETSAIDTK